MEKDEKIKYVFPFENRGDKVGTTMPHPHGQMYGFSVMPKKIELELNSAKKFKDNNGKCLFCSINEEEKSFGERMVYENDSFMAYVPFFADYAYGIYIVSKAHFAKMTEFGEKEDADLADIIKVVTGAYDELFDYNFPYMMCMHNAPVNSEEEYPNNADYFHFHIEFYPPMRSADKQQFMASSETGIWAHCNPTAPEEKAGELRAAVAKFLASGK
jgi:UDPglucose--hexose-1-phosphate uridylyltransferase